MLAPSPPPRAGVSFLTGLIATSIWLLIVAGKVQRLLAVWEGSKVVAVCQAPYVMLVYWLSQRAVRTPTHHPYVYAKVFVLSLFIFFSKNICLLCTLAS